MDKGAKDKLVCSPRENGGGQDAQKDLHSRTGKDEKKGKTQERMERGSRKRSTSAGSEKMERDGGRQEKMEGHCSTGQSPQWAAVKMEEEEELYCNFTSAFVCEDVKLRLSSQGKFIRLRVLAKEVLKIFWHDKEAFTGDR